MCEYCKTKPINSFRGEDEDDLDGVSGHFYDLPEGEDYMSIYETLDRVKKEGEGGAAGGARAEGQARAKTKEATALHEGKLQVSFPKKVLQK